MSYIIGVDGGGTKTEAVAYDLGGHKISEGKAGYGNLLINEKQAIANIISAIEQCLAPIKGKCHYICLGLAGFGGVENSEGIENALRMAFNTPFTIVNDGIIAHAALLKGKDGILTISGTGSVSIGIHNGTEKMAGGWGHILGDEGSGYWIAMQAFIKMTKEEDEGLNYSHLTKSFLKKLGYHSVVELKKFIYSSTKAQIAAFVPLIVQHADTGDDFSQNILRKAGYHLSKNTLDVCRKLKFSEHVTIAIKGSILTNIPLVQSSFIHHIQLEKPDVKLVIEDVSSTLGCYYIALKHLR
ncbi:N-acetylmuramic acid/N-acetylglucosamine kinase [Peribacillus sp. Bi96]|uniref:N-acetylglucosamine kinase n=1 Tax=Peribacillus sp. Bi96 TaxID=2884273 RepID=UPI001D7C7268|nr:BadF/BadG/BcrA/BcrD ATPase family protein [Peribacillus sp. Bi96]CAH0261801.1 N-acetylmuramic acid/N-acetylglucosamine kinase [Peribacillus sp. Bi96]